MTHEIQHPENEGKVAVFDTEAEALTAQEMCYANHMANHNDNPDYTAQTTAWAIPRQRLDGKWDFPVCHHTDTTGAPNIEDYDPANYATEEEI
jgi:hypothetical protein